MREFWKWIVVILMVSMCVIPVNAADLTAPEVTGEAASLLPRETGSFGADLWYVIRGAASKALPNASQCCKLCLSLLGICMLLSMIRFHEGQSAHVVNLCAVVCISCLLLQSTRTMILLASETIAQMSDYMNLLLPVLTAALAAQGGLTSSAALYSATAVLDSLFGLLMERVLIPMCYIYLALAMVFAMTQETLLQKLRDMCKSILVWMMKILLYAFSGYLSITGVISGTVDQSALKAAKVTISSAVPVVGSIMADASETILISAGVAKNAIGVYGCLAVVGIVVIPFLRIGIQYGLMKLTSAVCSVFADKPVSCLLEDVSGLMGILLAMTGVVSMLLLISIVCFLRGLG